MKLVSLTVSGYKRFLEKSTLKLSGNMTVLVGPNEAGKTTLLRALRHLSHSDPIDDKEFYRYRRTKEARIEAVYHLSSEDHATIGSTVPKRHHLWKEEDGKLNSKIEPKIERPKSHRPAFLKSALNCANSAAFKSMLASRIDEIDIVDEDDEEIVQRLRGLKQGIEELDFDTDTIDDVDLTAIEDFADFLSDQTTEKTPKYVLRFCETAKDFLEKERVEHPNEVARKKIIRSRPLVLEFTPDARTLNTTYNMRWFAPEDAQQQEEPSIALSNLCTVAGLDLNELDLNCKDNRRDLIASQITNANMALKAVFRKHYSQDDVSIELECSGSILSVMVGRVKDGRSSHNLVEERSEGFRQFAALLAFSLKEEARKPILLIDEAELHLHYDAQADLIQTFTSRDLTSQVIYSTHSAGCLPEDMGLGVKLVVPNNDSENVETSKIENKFWSSDTLGFSPLLYGMGANTLAFFPTRRAVVVEGQSDMLLLPTIFRQATKAEFNGFQIVPGLANVAKNRLPLLDLQGTSVSYLVDNDKDGRGYVKDLAKCNVDVERVFTVADEGSVIITVEDWVDDSCFNEAVAIYRDRYFSENEAPAPRYFNGPGKAAKLKAYEKTVSKTVQKVDLAYIVLELAWDDPDRKIYNSDHAKYICALAKSINDSFAG